MNEISFLEEKAFSIRESIIKSLESAGSGHIGGSLGLADIFAALYFKIMHHRPDEPLWSDRDRLILSIGHVAPVLYASLAESGYFCKDELLTLRKMGSRLQGHPSKAHSLPGIESASGSLGQGLGIAVGMAIGLKTHKNQARVFCILGDGELQEGSVWEAAMSASHHKLNNLIAIIDRNNLQIDGNTENILALEPLTMKWEAAGWKVKEINGHDFNEIISFVGCTDKTKPTVVIAKTKMGKGVVEIENNYLWHGKSPNKQETERFLKNLI